MSTLAVNAINAASGGTITITGAALTTPALGTPASGTLTNCTGFPVTSLSGYETGSWTPAASGWTVNPSFDFARYVKNGSQVTITLLGHGGTTNNGCTITGLPFTASSNSCGSVVAARDNESVAFTGAVFNGGAVIQNISAATIGGSSYWAASFSYFV